MSRVILISGLLLSMVLAVCLSGPINSNAGLLMGADGVSGGVYCVINEVTLFAKSAEDCEKAGGTVGDAIPAKAEEMSDNPNEEPEIQRTEDKDPEAP